MKRRLVARDPTIAPSLLERVRRDGTTLVILEKANAWMPLVSGAANPGIQYDGSFKVGSRNHVGAALVVLNAHHNVTNVYCVTGAGNAPPSLEAHIGQHAWDVRPKLQLPLYGEAPEDLEKLLAAGRSDVDLVRQPP